MRVLPLIALAAFCLATPTHAQSNWEAVGEALGKEGAVQSDGVYRVGFPRSDLRIMLDGVDIEPGLALGTWVAFKETDSGAMLTGDLVLTEEEVNPVMERLLEGGVEVTALHKHLVGTQPTPMYMHVGGEGDPAAMASTIRAALEVTETPLDRTSSEAPPKISLDTEAVDAILGGAGQVDGGIYKFSFPRAEPVTMHGMEIPPSMGSAIAINFQPTGDGTAATSGDFVMTADEVQPVLQALKQNGLSVMSLHNHMLEEEPRLFFVHFWGSGNTQDLARGLRAALDQIALKQG